MSLLANAMRNALYFKIPQHLAETLNRCKTLNNDTSSLSLNNGTRQVMNGEALLNPGRCSSTRKS